MTLLFTVLAGCDALDSLKEDVEALTNPVVIQGMYVGVAEPDAELDLSGTDFGKAAQATVLLADATSVDDLSNAPIEGAGVSVKSESGETALDDEGGGKYTASSEDGLTYTGGERFVLSVQADVLSKVAITAPPEPDAQVPESHPAGEPLVIDLAGQGFDLALVAVLDTMTGDLTFSNEPSDIQELYDFTHGGGEVKVEVPGGALNRQTVYAVGVAGLNAAEADDLEELNTALSAFLAGKFRFYPMSTL